MKTPALFAAVFACACGGSETPAPRGPVAPTGETGAATHTEMGGDHEKEAHDFPAEVTAFHDVLSPLWHAQAGEARANDTCAAIGKLLMTSMAVAEGPVPAALASDTAAWETVAEGLVASVSDLETTCATPDRRPMFDGSFKDVHDAFHQLTDRLGHDH